MLDSIIQFALNTDSAKLLVIVGLALVVLSIVRQIAWLEIIQNLRTVARVVGIILIAAGLYFDNRTNVSNGETPGETGESGLIGPFLPEGRDETYIIHFLSLSTQSAARLELDRLAKEYPEILGNYQKMIDPVVRPEDGLKLYRVNFGLFLSKEIADLKCLAFRNKADKCVPRARGGSIWID